MPPTFLIFMWALVWGLVAVAVLTLAAVLAIFTGLRPTAKRLASAMVGTFPGMVAYQLVAAPLAVAILLVGFLLVRPIAHADPVTHTMSDPIPIVLTIATVFLAGGIGIAASLVGAWRGWRAGWAFASGQDLAAAIEGDPLVRIASHIRNRLHLPKSRK